MLVNKKRKNGKRKLSAISISRLFFIAMMMMSASMSSAQSYAKLDTVIYLKDIQYTGASSSKFVASKVIGNYLFIGYVTGKYFNIKQFDINDTKEVLKTYKVKLRTKILTSDISDFTVNLNDKIAYILTYYNVLSLSLSNSKQIGDFNEYAFEYVFYDDDFLYLSRYYNYHPNNVKNKCMISRYSKSGLILDSLIINIPFPEYTIFAPNRFVTFNGQTFVVPLFDGYKLLLIDKDLKTIDTFSLEKQNWITPSIEISEVVENDLENLNSYIKVISKEDSERISRIEWVDFKDSNHLVVRYFQASPTSSYPIRFIDEYEYEESKLKPIRESVIESPSPTKNSLPIKEGHFPLFSANYKSFYNSERLIQIKLDVPVEISNTTTYKEYLQIRKERAIKQNPIISIWFFKYD